MPSQFQKFSSLTMILSSVKSFCVLTHMNNAIHGFACALHWGWIKVLFLLGCQTLRVMFQLSRAAHQLLCCLHTLSFCPSGEHWPEEVERPRITLKDGPIVFSHILACWDDSLSLWLYLMTICWCWVPLLVGDLCKVLLLFCKTLCLFIPTLF